MYSLESVKKGVANYLDKEFLPNIAKGTMEKMLIGTAIGIAVARSDMLIEKVKKNPMVEALHIIDEENRIDIETLEEEILKNTDDAGLKFNIPILDENFKTHKKEVVFYREDFEKLFNSIKGES